jgi:hypothetical protein
MKIQQPFHRFQEKRYQTDGSECPGFGMNNIPEREELFREEEFPKKELFGVE